MGGTNPYIKSAPPEPPKQKYRITFRGTGPKGTDQTVEVDPVSVPYGETGLPGSILDVAMHSGVDIDHACGGVSACSTCHVHVEKGLESCPEPSDSENDMLDLAPDLSPRSRLACQCVPTGKEDLVVSIPSWNRNNAREGK